MARQNAAGCRTASTAGVVGPSVSAGPGDVSFRTLRKQRKGAEAQRRKVESKEGKRQKKSLLAATLMFLPVLGVAQETPQDGWFQYRGPNRDGKSTEIGLIRTWGDSGPRRHPLPSRERLWTRWICRLPGWYRGWAVGILDPHPRRAVRTLLWRRTQSRERIWGLGTRGWDRRWVLTPSWGVHGRL